jgi:hypothetical protein
VLQSHKISSQSRGCKNSENRVNFNAKSGKSVCVCCAPHLIQHIFHIATAFYREQVAVANNSTRSLSLAIEKKNNFTFSRSGECFIFEGDLRAGKWGEKARGVCAAGLFPPGAAAAQSLNTMQSERTHTGEMIKQPTKGITPSARLCIFVCVFGCGAPLAPARPRASVLIRSLCMREICS